MKAPIVVRIGISLLVLGLVLRAVALFASIPQALRVQGTATGAAGEGVSLLFFAAFVYAMARRRNWARLVFAFLYVTGAILSMFFALLNSRLPELAILRGDVVGPQLALLVLIGAGMVCLFLPSAAAWYHGVPQQPNKRLKLSAPS